MKSIEHGRGSYCRPYSLGACQGISAEAGSSIALGVLSHTNLPPVVCLKPDRIRMERRKPARAGSDGLANRVSLKIAGEIATSTTTRLAGDTQSMTPQIKVFVSEWYAAELGRAQIIKAHD